MFSLRCDYRENRGGCVISTLQQLRTLGAVVPSDKYELRDEVMTTGDYAIQFSGYVILIERKTWEDLSASIKDKRIERNHQKMLAARDLGYRIMYLIEGKAPNPDLGTTKVSGIPYANMMAKLDHFAMRDGVWIEYTRNSTHTAQRLLEIGKNMLTLQRSAHEYKSAEVTATNPDSAPQSQKSEKDGMVSTSNAVSGTAAVETQSAETAASSTTPSPDHCTPTSDLMINTGDTAGSVALIRVIDNPDEIIKKKYEKSVSETRAAMLGCIPGIGPKTATSLLAAHSFSDIVTLAVKPAGLSSFQSSELAALAAGERPVIVVAMLQEIKGVSKTVAQKIAAAFDVKKLCGRSEIDHQCISNIRINEAGRRLGDALAARIVSSWADPPKNVTIMVTE